MSAAACDWPWATCLELLSDPQFVAASTGPRSVWEVPNCAPKPAPTTTQHRGRSTKDWKFLKLCNCLSPSANCLLGLVIERASDGMQVVYSTFQMSYKVGVSGITDWYRFKISYTSRCKSTHQKSQGTTRPSAICQVPADLCSVMGVLESLQGGVSSVYQVQTDLDFALLNEGSALGWCVREKRTQTRAIPLSIPRFCLDLLKNWSSAECNFRIQESRASGSLVGSQCWPSFWKGGG